MTDLITNRGPDDEGYYLSGNVGLGFRRLSIIDLNTGHQPLSNEDGSIWIIFNGEIYNHLELRRDLMRRGHRFRTQTDTESIVHLYEEYGRDCVRYLRGMFAFVIWDEQKKTLFCARDRFGIKPFFYYHDAEKFVFGSEIKSILADKRVSREYSVPALDYYLTFGYTPEDQTVYRRVKKLKPAHTLEIGPDGRASFNRYWKIQYQPDFSKTEREWRALIDEQLSESVKKHLISDVPLGAFLSGGVDSSAVVAMMARHLDRPVKTFSIGFKEAEFNELPYARQVAAAFGTEHHEQIVEPESVGLLSKLVGVYDEPFADSSAIPTYYVSKFAREHVTVALSGDGGDELFAGYQHYPRMKNLRDYNPVPDPVSQHLWGAVHRAIPAGIKGKGITYYLSRPKETLLAHFSIWHLTEREKLFRPGVWEQLHSRPAEQRREIYITQSHTDDYLFNMQQLDLRTYLVDDILTKVDRVSMLNSLEVRVPLLDHKFAELTFSIPSYLKLKGSQKKYIFKKALIGRLPQSILQHSKQGFGVPLKVWFKKDLRDYVHDRLMNAQGPIYDLVDPSFVAQTIRNHETGMRDFNHKIWSLLFLDEWLKQNQGSPNA